MKDKFLKIDVTEIEWLSWKNNSCYLDSFLTICFFFLWEKIKIVDLNGSMSLPLVLVDSFNSEIRYLNRDIDELRDDLRTRLI